MDLEFDVMFKEEAVAHIVVNNKLCEVDTYNNIPYKQPFFKKPVTRGYVNAFLEKRVVPKDKANIEEVLNQLNVKAYNVIEILKKTHGVSFDDFFWVKFNNENITWDEVRIR